MKKIIIIMFCAGIAIACTGQQEKKFYTPIKVYGYMAMNPYTNLPTSPGIFSLANFSDTLWISTESGWQSLWPVSGGGGEGTVTSVNVSGGTTGITASGGPITTSGTITLGGTLAVANGGTGVTTSTGSGSLVLSVSPTFTGTPTAPTAAPGTNTTQLATTAFVLANGGSGGAGDSTWNEITVSDTARIAALRLSDTLYANYIEPVTRYSWAVIDSVTKAMFGDSSVVVAWKGLTYSTEEINSYMADRKNGEVKWYYTNPNDTSKLTYDYGVMYGKEPPGRTIEKLIIMDEQNLQRIQSQSIQLYILYGLVLLFAIGLIFKRSKK